MVGLIGWSFLSFFFFYVFTVTSNGQITELVYRAFKRSQFCETVVFINNCLLYFSVRITFDSFKINKY